MAVLDTSAPTSTPDVPRDGRLYNEDLAPATKKNWGVYSLFCMWMSDVHSIGGYTFAAGLFFLGLNGWWVLAALVFAIFIVYGLMNLTGAMGQRLGVPYPVIARISFGVFGANLPAMIRALVGIAWYGIQTYLASVAVIVLLLKAFPGLEPMTGGGFLGLSPLGWICFLAIWAVQLLIIRRGMETVRRFQDWAGPAIWVVMAVLAVWILVKAGGNVSLNLSSVQLSTGEQILQFFSAMALTVSYFAALYLNFCDFSRFAPSMRAVRLGNLLGLPVNFIAFAIVTVLVTAGSKAVYGEFLPNPVDIVARVDSLVILLLGAVTFTVATLGINVVANFVSAAYDIANIAPSRLSFKRGGYIAATLALLVMPWKLYATPVAVNYFLGALGAFMGPLFGIIMIDYWLLRRQRVDVAELFRADGRYAYTKGVNVRAFLAFGVSATITAILALVKAFSDLAPFSWFIGAILGGGLYWLIARGRPEVGPAGTAAPDPATTALPAPNPA
ncbi:MAG TPA: NCS1 family nucleobase:cation symporter-1 [Micromonosporaceae bacterium]|nr:NCS1 family nucleobase:cation symporter-1 [Micromonosporaceae bacterium]